MGSVLVWRWDGVRAGRMELARQLARDYEAFWDKHSGAGHSSAVEWLASPDLSAPQMNMVRGDPVALGRIVVSADYERLIVRASLILTNVRQSWYSRGTSAEDLWATWFEVADEIERGAT